MRKGIGLQGTKRGKATVLVGAIMIATFLLSTGCGNDNAAPGAGAQSAGAPRTGTKGAKQEQAQKTQRAGMKAKGPKKEDKGKYFLARDELKCGGVTVRSVVRCNKEDNDGDFRTQWELLCDQELFIGDKRLAVPGGGVTWQWACIEEPGTSAYHPVIEFFTGGNHWEAEWTGVYDLKGNLILSDLIDPAKCSEKNSRIAETPDGFRDEYAMRGCSANAVKERKRNKKSVDALKRGHEKEFDGIYFGREG